jgi:hypothetical protein
MTGWNDLLDEALAALPTTEVVTRAKDLDLRSLSSDLVRDPRNGGRLRAREKTGYLLDGDLADFHEALDRLDRDTCRGGPCKPGRRCRRHTRRVRA